MHKFTHDRKPRINYTNAVKKMSEVLIHLVITIYCNTTPRKLIHLKCEF